MEQEPGRRDLRFKPEIKGKTPIERFEKMEMGVIYGMMRTSCLP